MAGAGYKLFQTGDVLTAAQVNTYLNEQTVMVFASAAARTSALTSVLAEGMMSYLQDTNSVEVYNGSSWVNVGNAGDITEVQAGVGISIASGTGPIPVITNSSTDLITTAGDLLYGTAADTVARLGIGTANQVLRVNSGATAPEWATPAGGGKVLQVVNTNTTTETSITSSSLTDTTITATITPSAATSKIAIFISANSRIQEGGQTDIFAGAALLRGATMIQDFDQSDGFWQRIGGASGTLRLITQQAVIYLDSPNTTSATTYKLQARVISPLTTINFQKDSVPSNILLMEIGA
jgi:hypothetical protein